MACESRSRRTNWLCQAEHAPHKPAEWHKATENGRSITWNDAAGYIRKETTVNFIIPGNFRAVKGQ